MVVVDSGVTPKEASPDPHGVLNLIHSYNSKSLNHTRTTMWGRYGPNARCVYCGNHANTMDHVTPRAQGGTNDIDNTVPSCLTCNGQKANKRFVEFLISRPQAAFFFLLHAKYANREYLLDAYEAAERFGGDVRAFLKGLPVEGYEFWKPVFQEVVKQRLLKPTELPPFINNNPLRKPRRGNKRKKR